MGVPVLVLGLLQIGWIWFGYISLSSIFENSRPKRSFRMINILFMGVPLLLWVQVLGFVQQGWTWFGYKSLSSKFERSRSNRSFKLISILVMGVPVLVWVQVLGIFQLDCVWFCYKILSSNLKALCLPKASECCRVSFQLL